MFAFIVHTSQPRDAKSLNPEVWTMNPSSLSFHRKWRKTQPSFVKLSCWFHLCLHHLYCNCDHIIKAHNNSTLDSFNSNYILLSVECWRFWGFGYLNLWVKGSITVNKLLAACYSTGSKLKPVELALLHHLLNWNCTISGHSPEYNMPIRNQIRTFPNIICPLEVKWGHSRI